jgi:hypothetical protein
LHAPCPRHAHRQGEPGLHHRVLRRTAAGHVGGEREGLGDDVGREVHVLQVKRHIRHTRREVALGRHELTLLPRRLHVHVHPVEEREIGAAGRRRHEREVVEVGLDDVAGLHALVRQLLRGGDVHRHKVVEAEVHEQIFEEGARLHRGGAGLLDLDAEQLAVAGQPDEGEERQDAQPVAHRASR